MQVQQVNGNVGAIVEASREQATGLKEINTAVNTMDQGNQQNAAMVEEATAAAHSLAHEADGLFQLLSQFQIGTGASSSSRLAAAPASRTSRPVESPARRMVEKVAHSFRHSAAAANQSWEEF